MSSNTNNNDISIRNKDDNKFDAVMEIKTEDINVSITLENYGSVTDESEEALSSILFNPKKENKLYKSYLTIIVILIFLNGCTQNNQPPAWVETFRDF